MTKKKRPRDAERWQYEKLLHYETEKKRMLRTSKPADDYERRIADVVDKLAI